MMGFGLACAALAMVQPSIQEIRKHVSQTVAFLHDAEIRYVSRSEFLFDPVPSTLVKDRTEYYLVAQGDRYYYRWRSQQEVATRDGTRTSEWEQQAEYDGKNCRIIDLLNGIGQEDDGRVPLLGVAPLYNLAMPFMGELSLVDILHGTHQRVPPGSWLDIQKPKATIESTSETVHGISCVVVRVDIFDTSGTHQWTLRVWLAPERHYQIVRSEKRYADQSLDRVYEVVEWTSLAEGVSVAKKVMFYEYDSTYSSKQPAVRGEIILQSASLSPNKPDSFFRQVDLDRVHYARRYRSGKLVAERVNAPPPSARRAWLSISLGNLLVVLVLLGLLAWRKRSG